MFGFLPSGPSFLAPRQAETITASNGPRLRQPPPVLDCLPLRCLPARASAVRSFRSLFCTPQPALRSTRRRSLHLLARTISRSSDEYACTDNVPMTYLLFPGWWNYYLFHRESSVKLTTTNLIRGPSQGLCLRSVTADTLVPFGDRT